MIAVILAWAAAASTPCPAVVATSDLPVGHRVTDADIRIVQAPCGALHEHVVRDPDDARRKIVLEQIFAGEAVRLERLDVHVPLEVLTLNHWIPKGMRGVSIPVDPGALTSLLFGIYVDVYGMDPAPARPCVVSQATYVVWTEEDPPHIVVAAVAVDDFGPPDVLATVTQAHLGTAAVTIRQNHDIGRVDLGVPPCAQPHSGGR